MEADGIFVGALGRDGMPVGWQKTVFAFDGVAIGADADAALMQHAEVAGIAVMRGDQGRGAGGVAALDLVRTGDNRCAGKQTADRSRFEKMAGRRIVEGYGRMRRGGARHLPPVLPVHRRQAAIDDQPVLFP